MIALTIDQLQQREGRWVIPDLEGKGGRIRTIPIPALVKVRIDDWLRAAALTEGRIFRSVNKGDTVVGDDGSVATVCCPGENGRQVSGVDHVRVQVASIRRRDHPLGGSLVLPVRNQLP